MKQIVTKEARRAHNIAEQAVQKYRTVKGNAAPLKRDTLRVVALGGQNGIGEKNMIVVEYNDDVIVLDCGFELGVDLPGVNYAIPVTDYLRSIRHKLRGYIISHGHLDHIGALTHVVPGCPAPIIGSRFTIGMVDAQFDKASEDRGLAYQQETIVLDMDRHETMQLGVFTIELVRVTHSIPESSAIVIGTPQGRLVHTGDFRLDPEPLDDMPTDIARLKQLGNEGVLLLLSESTNTTRPGRTPTEQTLQNSFRDLIGRARGRVFTAVFSSNMNRIQMVIDAAVAHDRKVLLEGRSMMMTAEIAVRLGSLKIPKGVLVSSREALALPDKKLVIICTGGQGEPGAAMSRMSTGEHRSVTLNRSDTVVISSTPIPGNERSYQQLGDDLARIGVSQYRHPTHEIDGCGPLHVSGHAFRDEHAEMITLTRPSYVMPIYGGALNRAHHRDIALTTGMKKEQVVLAHNGEVVELSCGRTPIISGKVSSGAHLIDSAGRSVSERALRDRLMLQSGNSVAA